MQFDMLHVMMKNTKFNSAYKSARPVLIHKTHNLLYVIIIHTKGDIMLLDPNFQCLPHLLYHVMTVIPRPPLSVTNQGLHIG